jgi:hypothetical protein
VFDLTTAVLSLTTHELKYTKASLSEINLKGALKANVTEFIERLKRSQAQPGGSLQARVDATAARLQESDAELTTLLLTELADAVEAQPVELASAQGCSDMCTLILSRASETYRETHSSVSVANADDFVREVVCELTASLTPKTPDETTETLTAAAEAAKTADWVNAAAALSATTVRLGLTPSETTPRLSLLALLASPAFLAGLTGGASVLQYRKQDNALRDRYVPAMVALLLLGGLDQEVVADRAEQVAGFWQQQLDGYRQHLSASNVVTTELNRQQAALDEARAVRKQAETEARQERGAIASAVDEVEELLAHDESLVTGLAAGGPVQHQAQEYVGLKARLALARNAEPAKGLGAKLMAGLKRGVAEAELAISIKRSQGQLAQSVVAAPAEVLPSALAAQAANAAAARLRATEADTRADAAGARAAGLQEVCRKLLQEKERLADLMKDLEDRFPGIGQAAGTGIVG